MDIVYVMDEGHLKPVEELGGLDAYLRQISDLEETARRNDEAVEAHEQQVQQLVNQLQQENKHLQERLSTNNQPTLGGDGTIYINH
jgi:cell shape-determining protein MreC